MLIPIIYRVIVVDPAGFLQIHPRRRTVVSSLFTHTFRAFRAILLPLNFLLVISGIREDLRVCLN